MSAPTIRTPCILEALIHCFVTGLPHPRGDAPAVKQALHYLHDHGLISQPHGAPRVTEKGRFYLEHLLAQPFPVESYAIPRSES